MWKLRAFPSLSIGQEHYQEFELFRPDAPSAAMRELPGLSAINMFVGANHSGKSRFLRALAKDLTLGLGPTAEETRGPREASEAFIDRWHMASRSPWPSDFFNHVSRLAQKLQTIFGDSKHEIPLNNDLLEGFRNYHTVFDEFAKSSSSMVRTDADDARASAVSALKAAYQSLLDALPVQPFGSMPARIYIPVLRGLRLFSQSNTIDSVPDDHYRLRTLPDYYSGSGHVEVFTGYTLYHSIRSLLLGNQDQRKRIRDYEKFLSEHFFEGKEVTLTPRLGSVLHVTIDGEEQAIHDMGDGLQSAIILTFEPFVREQPCLFFIEEPELFLHPGLQRHILEFFRSCENHLFFFTTHSNHFLGMSFDYDDISIYNFRRKVSATEQDKPRFMVTPVSRGDHSSLEILGVRNSSVFLVNATIWVEGVTDRRYMRKFLELYKKHCELPGVSPEEDIRKLEEDIHYAFVEYAGANLAHWSFAAASDVESQQSEANDSLIAVRTLCGSSIPHPRRGRHE